MYMYIQTCSRIIQCTERQLSNIFAGRQTRVHQATMHLQVNKHSSSPCSVSAQVNKQNQTRSARVNRSADRIGKESMRSSRCFSDLGKRIKHQFMTIPRPPAWDQINDLMLRFCTQILEKKKKFATDENVIFNPTTVFLFSFLFLRICGRGKKETLIKLGPRNRTRDTMAWSSEHLFCVN